MVDVVQRCCTPLSPCRGPTEHLFGTPPLDSRATSPATPPSPEAGMRKLVDDFLDRSRAAALRVSLHSAEFENTTHFRCFYDS